MVKMEKRDSFVFYRSFHEAARLLEPGEQLAVLSAINDYALDGAEPELSGAAAAVFLMARPNLDANRRKYENGKKKKTKREANGEQREARGEQTGANGDADADADENADENENGNEAVAVAAAGDAAAGGQAPAPAAAVELAYRRRISPMLTESALRELRGYGQRLGEDCCLRAMDEALNAGKASWPYLRAILRDKEAKGVRCLADWDALEAKRGGSGGRVSFAEVARQMDEEETLVL